MISNFRQYSLTKKALEDLTESLSALREIDSAAAGIDPLLTEAHRRSLKLQIQDLSEQVRDYEQLATGEIESINVESFEDVGSRLISARIANGWSQSELAQRLGMKEQQVQRYEKERYSSASLDRIIDISRVLRVRLHGKLEREDTTKSAVVSVKNFLAEIDISSFPFAEMVSKGWLDSRLKGLRDGDRKRAEIHRFFDDAGVKMMSPMLNKRTDKPISEKARCSLLAWQTQVRLQGRRECSKMATFRGIEPALLKSLVHFSTKSEGPKLAVNALKEIGVCVVIVPHLQGSLLDGAAMLQDNGNPLIGLTLRDDRLDNFWFVLFHELGHIAKHRYSGLAEGFLDQELDEVEDKREIEANDFARSALISDEAWARSFVRFSNDPSDVIEFANDLGISPAIVAGRIRFERKDYKIFNGLLERGRLKPLFGV